MKELQPESSAGAERKRTFRPEANVAPGIEVELGELVGQGRGRLERRRRKLARAPQHVVVTEAWRRRDFGLGLRAVGRRRLRTQSPRKE